MNEESISLWEYDSDRVCERKENEMKEIVPSKLSMETSFPE